MSRTQPLKHSDARWMLCTFFIARCGPFGTKHSSKKLTWLPQSLRGKLHRTDGSNSPYRANILRTCSQPTTKNLVHYCPTHWLLGIILITRKAMQECLKVLTTIEKTIVYYRNYLQYIHHGKTHNTWTSMKSTSFIGYSLARAPLMILRAVQGPSLQMVFTNTLGACNQVLGVRPLIVRWNCSRAQHV